MNVTKILSAPLLSGSDRLRAPITLCEDGWILNHRLILAICSNFGGPQCIFRGGVDTTMTLIWYESPQLGSGVASTLFCSTYQAISLYTTGAISCRRGFLAWFSARSGPANRFISAFARLNGCESWMPLIPSDFDTLFRGYPAKFMSKALLWKPTLCSLSIIACSTFERKAKSSYPPLTITGDWNSSWQDLGRMWHSVLAFNGYFRKVRWPLLQRLHHSGDIRVKVYVRIILGHPVVVILIARTAVPCPVQSIGAVTASVPCSARPRRRRQFCCADALGGFPTPAASGPAAAGSAEPLGECTGRSGAGHPRPEAAPPAPARSAASPACRSACPTRKGGSSPLWRAAASSLPSPCCTPSPPCEREVNCHSGRSHKLPTILAFRQLRTQLHTYMSIRNTEYSLLPSVTVGLLLTVAVVDIEVDNGHPFAGREHRWPARKNDSGNMSWTKQRQIILDRFWKSIYCETVVSWKLQKLKWLTYWNYLICTFAIQFTFANAWRHARWSSRMLCCEQYLFLLTL